MNKLNVFKEYYIGTWQYNIKHPLKTIKSFFCDFKAAWQRATKGYCDYDVWDVDAWLLRVLPDILRELSKISHGSPVCDEIDSYEKWQKLLCKLADDFERCQDSEDEAHNEYSEYYMNELDDKWVKNGSHLVYKEKTELDKKYFARREILVKEQQKRLEDTFALLAKWLRAMWD